MSKNIAIITEERTLRRCQERMLPMSISHFEFRDKVFVKCPLSPLREHYFELLIWYNDDSFREFCVYDLDESLLKSDNDENAISILY